MLCGICFCLPVSASELHRYGDPIPLGNYVDDLEAMLSRAVARSNWTLSKNESGQYVTGIHYHDYVLKVALPLEDGKVRVQLVSAERPECIKRNCKVDADKVETWLTMMRRNIAYELTLMVRDHALVNMSKS